MRPAILRILGLTGGLLLAAAAWLGGAKPGTDLRSDLGMALSQPATAAAIGLWALGLAALGVAWWKARTVITTVRGTLVTAALWAAPLLFAPPLSSRDLYAYACQGATFSGGLNPYETGVAALPCPWLDTVSLVWHDTPAPYGPLWVFLAGAAAWFSGGHLVVAVTLLRVAALAGAVLIAWVLPRLAPPEHRVTATWLGLASPLLLVHVVSGGHNDALMIGLALLGLYMARERRPVWAGVWIGAAVAVKATAGIALPFVVLLLARDRTLKGILRAAVWPVLAAAWAFSVSTGSLGFGWLRGLATSGDSVQWTSPPTAVGMAIGAVSKMLGHNVTTGAIEASRLVGWAALAVALVVIWLRAARVALDEQSVLRHLAYALVAVIALSPVFHPWYVLWPLAVLAVAVHSGRLHRTGLLAAVALPALTLPDGDNLALRTKLPGAFAMTALVIAAVVYGLRRVRAALRASRQPPRQPGHP